jgi:hypothetical protein
MSVTLTDGAWELVMATVARSEFGPENLKVQGNDVMVVHHAERVALVAYDSLEGDEVVPPFVVYRWDKEHNERGPVVATFEGLDDAFLFMDEHDRFHPEEYEEGK